MDLPPTLRYVRAAALIASLLKPLACFAGDQRIDAASMLLALCQTDLPPTLRLVLAAALIVHHSKSVTHQVACALDHPLVLSQTHPWPTLKHVLAAALIANLLEALACTATLAKTSAARYPPAQ